jgi:hypothetical protein
VRLFRQSMTGITSKDSALMQMREDAPADDREYEDTWYAVCPYCLVLVPVELDPEKGRPAPCSECGGSLKESLQTISMVRVRWARVHY